MRTRLVPALLCAATVLLVGCGGSESSSRPAASAAEFPAATPALCQSRVCGPVVDVAQQVADQYEGKADFIHMVIRDRIEGAFGVSELGAAMRTIASG